MTVNLAETSVAKSRPSVLHAADLYCLNYVSGLAVNAAIVFMLFCAKWHVTSQPRVERPSSSNYNPSSPADDRVCCFFTVICVLVPTLQVPRL